MHDTAFELMSAKPPVVCRRLDAGNRFREIFSFVFGKLF